MKPSILPSLLLTLLVAGPASVAAHDSSSTGLGNVPSGMGLGTAPGGKLDRKQDRPVSRDKREHKGHSKDFHHRRHHKPHFHGSGIRFQPHQIYIIQDPEARHRAKRYGENAEAKPEHDTGAQDSFDQLRNDFGGSRSFEEIRSQYLSGQ